VLPNAGLPVITVLGLNAAGLIAGAVVVEAVFGLPGLGQVLQNAVEARDYPLLQGVALVTALLVVLINALTDLTYALVDPRTRTSP
jgi:peptide/nickel transport system permease protein